MEEIIEVTHFEFREPNPIALEENVCEMYVPVWMIADIYINGKNLILHLYGYEDEKQLYEDIVGATIPSMLRDFYYEPHKVKTAWLYECSGCYRCYTVETDVYFLSNLVVWRYFHFPYSVKKTVLIFPLEVYLKGYETLKELAKAIGIDPKEVLKKKTFVHQASKNLEKFKHQMERFFNLIPLEDYTRLKTELPKLASAFESVVGEVLWELGFHWRGDRKRLLPAVRFLKIYNPQRLEEILKQLKEEDTIPLKTLEGLKVLMEKALKRCEELLKQ